MPHWTRIVCAFARAVGEDERTVLRTIRGTLQTSKANKLNAHETVRLFDKEFDLDGDYYVKWHRGGARRRSHFLLPRAVFVCVRIQWRKVCVGVWILGTYAGDRPRVLVRQGYVQYVAGVIDKLEVRDCILLLRGTVFLGRALPLFRAANPSGNARR
jgi:hypothetical protein